MFLISVGLNVSLASSRPDDLLLDSEMDGIISPFDFFGDADPSSNFFASTACAAQQESTDEWSLLSRNDNICHPPPLSSDSLQLLQDPLDSIEQIFPPNEESKANYAGLLTPAQQLEKERNPNPCEAYLLFGYIYHLCCLFAKGQYPEYVSVSSCFQEPSMSLPKRKSRFRTANGILR